MKREMHLDADEKGILASYDRGEWKSVKNKALEIRKHRQYARNTIQKDKRVNIRISTRDLEGLQAIAVQDGLPYQTLMSSILHKFVAGRLVDKK
jgi:predicted DNA binding CopG/RHH family protein